MAPALREVPAWYLRPLSSLAHERLDDLGREAPVVQPGAVPLGFATSRPSRASLVVTSTRLGTRPLSPSAPFPSTSISLTAISFMASPRRAASARADSSSKSRAQTLAPDRDFDNASSAPSFATVRMRMTTPRSTCQRSATSMTVTSWRTSWRKISYFCSGLEKRLARRPAEPVNR